MSERFALEPAAGGDQQREGKGLGRDAGTLRRSADLHIDGEDEPAPAGAASVGWIRLQAVIHRDALHGA